MFTRRAIIATGFFLSLCGAVYSWTHGSVNGGGGGANNVIDANSDNVIDANGDQVTSP